MMRYASLLLLLSIAIAASQASAAAPNIVIINMDDFGWGDFGAYGSSYAQTPNVDRLAADGMKFTQFYSGAPICSPSRAALFTGQYAARSGINSFLDSSASNLSRDNADSLSLTAPSMARAFQDGGYATGHFGKWHLGGGRDVGYAVNPTAGTNVSAPRIVDYGYDEAWTQFEGLGNRIINVEPYGGTAAGTSVRTSNYFNGLNQTSDARGTGGGLDEIVYLERQYNATFMIDRAIDFLDQSKAAEPNKPVFMNVWLDESHTPHVPPAALQAKYNALYPSLPAESRDYLAILEYADQQIGRLVDHIDQQGLGEETLILVMADNGATGANAGSIGSNGPFRGSKGSMFEGGFREPLIARWTGNVTAGRTDDDTVIWGADMLPTLLGVAGVGAPTGAAFDGENMSQALLSGQSQTRTTPLFWNMNRGTEDRHSNPNPAGAGANGQEAFAIRSGDWKLLLNADGTAPELYNLSNDVGETNNLATSQPAVVQDLASQGLAIRYSTPSRNLPDTATPIVRLKAQDLAPLSNGAAVGSWSDSATGDALNGTVSQANAANRPTLATNALNGKAVVTFDGDDALQSSTTNSLPVPGQGITVFAVATSDTSGATAERLGQIGRSNGAAGSVAGLDVSSTPTTEANGGAGFRYNNGSSLYDTPLADAGFHIVVWQVDDGQAYSDAKLFVDGTLPANTFTGSGGTTSVSFSGNDLELLLGTGRGATGTLLTTDYFSGQLAEFVVFNNQLSVGQINLVANYLSSEYALPFAYDTTLNVFDIDGLAWTGGTSNFTAAWNAGNGSGGLSPNITSPFSDGGQALFLGNGGTAQFNDSTVMAPTDRIKSMRIGTAHAGLIIDDAQGDGTLIASGSKSLTIGNGAVPTGSSETGDVTVGEAGHNGVVTWGSSGTLKIEGRLRVGQGGTGVFTQTAGTVSAGDVGGTLKFAAVGNGAGSHGTYNLNNGRLQTGGGLSGVELRQLRIGTAGGVGLVNVGDGAGAAGSARFESRDDIFVGQDGGNGTLTINADGAIVLQGSNAEFHVANNNGATGLVIQSGGSVSTQAMFGISTGAGSNGEYLLSGGTVTATGLLRIAATGSTGKLQVSGNGSLISSGNIFVGHGDGAGSKGTLELVGSDAFIQVGRLQNALGVDETIRWVADADGVTPLNIVGSGGVERVQLQTPTELSANTGVNGQGNLRGDGIALSLDLSAITASRSLTLINNQTTHGVTGFFENGLTGNLYEQGEQILGTGFHGTVSISYVGGTGNDVVLSLVASPFARADFNLDGRVDGADFLAWQSGFGQASPGDADGNGIVNAADLEIWKSEFGSAVVSAGTSANSAVPEPSSFLLMVSAGLLLRRFRSS